MTISNPDPGRHTDEPEPTNPNVHRLVWLAAAMMLVFAVGSAVYLAIPGSKFWVEVGVGLIAPVVAEVVGQLNDKSGRSRAD